MVPQYPNEPDQRDEPIKLVVAPEEGSSERPVGQIVGGVRLLTAPYASVDPTTVGYDAMKDIPFSQTYPDGNGHAPVVSINIEPHMQRATLSVSRDGSGSSNYILTPAEARTVRANLMKKYDPTNPGDCDRMWRTICYPTGGMDGGMLLRELKYDIKSPDMYSRDTRIEMMERAEWQPLVEGFSMAFARSSGGPISVSFFFETDGSKRAFIESKLRDGSGHGKPMAGKRDCIATMDALRKLDPTDPAIGDKLLTMMEAGQFPEELAYGKQ